MRLPHLRPRLRLRTLLIAVAVVAVAIGGWQMWKRREYCRERADGLILGITVGRDVVLANEQFALAARQVAESERMELRRRNDLAPLAVAVRSAAAERQERLASESEARAGRARINLSRAIEYQKRLRRVARYPWLPIPSEPERKRMEGDR